MSLVMTGALMYARGKLVTPGVSVCPPATPGAWPLEALLQPSTTRSGNAIAASFNKP